ncbi:MAG: 1-(5-phosphoribosyl)-5-[(5-phosphoribosylamino) methylideneamino]imidazole-4-carboxamide isomerase [Candidatus Sumerlaeia bacterium]
MSSKPPMFTIIPAIDLMDGACVRLRQGQSASKTVYSREPVSVAQRWQQCGARRLHVVDLDGAFEGVPRNSDVIAAICRTVKMDVEVGGGLRTIETVEQVLRSGARWAVLGTRALNDPDFLAECLRSFPGRILVGVDARDGVVAVKGWTKGAGVHVSEILPRLEASGCEEIIFTDIGRDGMLSGPNLTALRDVARRTNMRIIASGGVAKLDDLAQLLALNAPNLTGVIAGKAIYEGTLDLAEAVRRFQTP